MRTRQEVNIREFENYLIDRKMIGKNVDHRLYATLGRLTADPVRSEKLTLGDIPLRYAGKYQDQPLEAAIGRKIVSPDWLPYSLVVGRLLPPFAKDAANDDLFELSIGATDYISFSKTNPDRDTSFSGVIQVGEKAAVANLEIVPPEGEPMEHDIFAFASQIGLGALVNYVVNRTEPGTIVEANVNLFPQMQQVLATNLDGLIDPPQLST